MRSKCQRCCQNIDKQQLFNLVTGILGIYIIFFTAGIIHQSVIKQKFQNFQTGESEMQNHPLGIVLVPFGVAWIIAAIFNIIFIEQKVQIPRKNSLLCGGAMAFTSVLSIVAIKFTSYPVVLMFESCNALSVVLVAVFCSRVSERRLKLGKKKLIIAALITTGILLFQIFNPQTQDNNQESNIIGFCALIIWVIVEGFFPDLQAQIKSKFKPQATEMMSQINKWGTIVLLGCMLISWRLWDFLLFMIFHPIFTLELFVMSVVSAFGQFFVYRMIKQFKQHVLPFTITTRKIFSVVLSIMFYKHQTHPIQQFGIVLVLGTVAFDFITEIQKKPSKEKNPNSQEQIQQTGDGKNYNLNEEKDETQKEKQIVESEELTKQ